jgi:hypothetical protein
MRIFLSYASEHRNVAEPIAFTLRGRGHRVFLDKDDLPPGKSYDDQIAQAIEDSDLFIFLISPESVDKGRFTLTELGFARQKWPVASRNILPVVIKPVDFGDIPNYLKAVSVLEPVGNVAAEVSNAVQRLGHGAPVRVVLPIMAALGLLSGVFGGLLPSFLPVLPIGAPTQDGVPTSAVLLALNFQYAPLHVALLFSIVIGGALWYWERATAWSLVAIVIAVFVGWIAAHNAWRHLYIWLDQRFHINLRGSVENAGAIQFQLDLLSHVILTSASVVAGLVGAIFTSFGAMIASKRLQRASVLFLVAGLGAVCAAPMFFAVIFGQQHLVYGLWQMAVAAAIGYGLSRPMG